MGHFTVRCAKTTEPIDMPFWMKTRVGPRNHVLDADADPPKEGAILAAVRAIQKHWQSSLQPSLQRRCRVRRYRDHSIANNVMHQTGSFRRPGKRK